MYRLITRPVLLAPLQCVFDEKKYAKPLKKPWWLFFGSVFFGLAYFELIEINDAKTKEVFITFSLGKKPVLKAVTEEQEKSWQKKKIIAKPATLTWKKERILT